MKDKIKVIVKEPGEPAGHWEEIGNTLEALQEKVGGYIETVTISGAEMAVCADDITLIVNEEGKNLGLPWNINLFIPGRYIDRIAGSVIVAGTEGEEVADCPLSMEEWEHILVCCGNTIRKGGEEA